MDVLGFSLGGFVAQALAVADPSLVRRLILVGTGPRGGEAMATLTPEAQGVFGATYATANLLIGISQVSVSRERVVDFSTKLSDPRVEQRGLEVELARDLGNGLVTLDR